MLPGFVLTGFFLCRKHHKPHQLLVVVIFSYIMVLSQATDGCPNYSVKKIKLFSDLSKGYLRVERNRVVASESEGQDLKENYLYKVTIDKHYMLLYHIDSGKFICWNKSYKKLVPRRNPTNITYCKFNNTVSIIEAYKKHKARVITRDNKGREVEIRFNRSGAFARPKLMEKCIRHLRLHEKVHCEVKEFLKWVLDPAQIQNGTKQMEAYIQLITRCAGPHLVMKPVACESTGQSDFCIRMKEIHTSHHKLSPEIQDLCKIKDVDKN
ncbi:hypothetical protein Zmor_000827 [Zophobas morio]|uniref:Uncharacterized protein n=1 Tax=Zophobas morio TaxID=2755281 RepID=A0AA38IX52_9CUCU|nr:hypothetical protein Zmor_000827 [Zophobas morio]